MNKKYVVLLLVAILLVGCSKDDGKKEKDKNTVEDNTPQTEEVVKPDDEEEVAEEPEETPAEDKEKPDSNQTSQPEAPKKETPVEDITNDTNVGFDKDKYKEDDDYKLITSVAKKFVNNLENNDKKEMKEIVSASLLPELDDYYSRDTSSSSNKITVQMFINNISIKKDTATASIRSERSVNGEYDSGMFYMVDLKKTNGKWMITTVSSDA